MYGRELMNWPIPITVLLSAVASLATLASAGRAWSRRDVRGSRACAAAQIAASLWLVSAMPDLPGARALGTENWTSVQHAVLAAWALGMLFFSIRFTGRPRWLQGRARWMLTLAPAISLLALWLASGTVSAAAPPGELATPVSSAIRALCPGSKFQIGYGFVLIAAAIAFQIWHRAAPAPFRQRQQSAFVLAAVGVPALGLSSIHLSLLPALTDYAALAVMSMVVLVSALAVLRHTPDDSPNPALNYLFDSIAEPVFILDARDRVVEINPAGVQMLGGRKDAYLGQPLTRLLTGLDVTAFTAPGDAVDVTLDWSLPDGQTRRYSVHVSPLRDSTKFLGRAVVLHDVTALTNALHSQQQTAAAAEEASRRSNDFFAVLSHEVRTPMQAVIGMTGLLLGTELTDEQRDYVDTIRSSGDSMLAIVNNVLDFSKIEAGQIELEQEPYDPLAAVEDTLVIFAGQAAIKHLELAYVVGEDVPGTIVGDVTRFRQVLTNLVANAVKFTDRGEVTIYVSSQTENPRVRLHVRVRDTGIGIPGDRMDRLFHSFSQVSASTARRYGGTGLGLAICKRLCEIMGGDVWVESHAGVGSTFHFTVIAEPVASPSLALTRLPALEGRRTLVVDDSPASREMLSRILGAWGMQVETVESGWAAMQVLEKDPAFDVILIDMHMPVMDGEACARRIRAMRHRPQPRLIMMLALTDSSVRTRATELGLDSVVVKPVKRSQLRGALSDIFAARDTGDAQAGARTSASLPQRRSDKTVLLADDNRVGQRVTQALLRRLGYRADVVSSGKEVLAAFEDQPYDIVLMDVHMPEMDGLTTTRKIREDRAGENQPYVIALTASTAAGDRQECLNAGMDDYLSKPISIGGLREALERAETSSEDSL